MNETENNFKDLKNLLKLKRHEVPPPGFFNHFSDGVIARIREAESGTLVDRLNDQAPWLVRFLRVFEAKPGVIGGFATSLCLLLLFGVVLAERSESGPQNFMTASAAPANSLMSNPSPSPSLASGTTPEFGSAENGIAISTNASLQPVATLFGQSAGGASLFQPASFAPAH